MKHDIRYKRWWIVVLAGLLAVVIFRHVWEWLPERRYHSLISNNNLVTALDSGNTVRVAQLAHADHFDYQVFNYETLTYSSNSKLPDIQLFFQRPATPGVIAASTSQQLQATVPYQLQLSFHHYVFFAATPANTAPGLVYVIYGKVF